MIPRDGTLHMACSWHNLAPEAVTTVARREREEKAKNPNAHIYLVDRGAKGIDLRVHIPKGAAVATAVAPEPTQEEIEALI